MRINVGILLPVRQGIAVLLAALVALTPSASVAASGTSAVVASSGLSVGTDPDGAEVYLDGRFAGRTPLTIDSVSTGDHRVRVVKSGHLENARVVNVQAGQPRSLQIRLTPQTASAAQAAAQGTAAPKKGGGILSNKWLWIGAAGAGGGAAYYVMTKNAAPVAGSVTANPATALAGLSVRLAASGASDPDGDSLSYAWDFGDGGTGSGQTATHVYASTGSFTVKVTVSDGKKQASATGSVTVRSLTGTWSGTIGLNSTITLNLTQSGTSLSGTNTVSAASLTSGSVSGSVTSLSSLQMSVGATGFVPIILSGSVDPSLDRISGSVVSGFNTTLPTFSITRR